MMEFTPLSDELAETYLPPGDLERARRLGGVQVAIVAHVDNDPCPAGTIFCQRSSARPDTWLSTVLYDATEKPVAVERPHPHSVGLVA